MFDFIYDNIDTIIIAVVILFAVVGIGANIQDFNDQRQRQQRRSQAAIKGWATRRSKVQE